MFPRAVPRPNIRLSKPAPRKVESASELRVPIFLPPNVESFFRQARHNLILENWDAAGVMYRKALEASLISILGSTSGELKSDIVKAVTVAGTANNFQGFSNIVRVFGNSAAHKNDFSEAHARILDSIVEAILVYLHTIPGVVKEDQHDTGLVV